MYTLGMHGLARERERGGGERERERERERKREREVVGKEREREVVERERGVGNFLSQGTIISATPQAPLVVGGS